MSLRSRSSRVLGVGGDRHLAQFAFLVGCLLLSLALYWPGLPAPFVFDSTPTIRDNPFLRFRGYGFDEWLAAMLSTDTGPLKRPLSMLSFALNAAISGPDSPFSFNLTNLLIHWLNALLVLFCVHRLYAASPWLNARAPPRGRAWIALITAAVFLLHPIQLPAVLHTVQRMAALSFTFVLLAMAIYLVLRQRVLEQGLAPKTVVDGVTLVGLMTVLGALAKENALLTPWLLLVVELVFFRFKSAGRPQPWLARIALLLLITPIVALALYLVLWRPDLVSGLYADRDFTPTERLMTQAKVLWIYLYWLLVPGAAGAGLHHDDIAIARSLWEPGTAVSMFGWGFVVAVLLPATARRYPLLAFAFAWYLVAHALESSIVPLEMVYEHRNYGALLGFVMLLADGLWSVRNRRPLLFGAATLGLVGILSIPLATRASLWGDEMALAANQLKHHPESLRSRYHFANLHLRMADAATDPEAQRRAVLVAEHYYREMLEIDSQDIVALATLFYIDGRYFGGTRHQQILVELLDAIGKPVFSKTDHNALVLLKDCSVRRYCARNDQEYALIVEGVARRTDVSPAVTALMRATYAAEVSNDAGAAVATLRTAGVDVAGDSAAQKLLLTWELQSGDLPGAMETARRIYAGDRSHAQLALLRRATAAMQASQ